MLKISPEIKIRNFLEALSVSGKGLLVGFSGGVDSTVLLKLLHAHSKALRFRLAALHVEHGLRGKEGRADASFCRRVCGTLKIPFVLVKKNIRLLAEKEKSSIELAARNVRKQAFRKAALRLDCEFVFLGHTQDDQLETLLFRLFRGSGLHGMSGMQEVIREKGVVFCRPLLGFSKAALKELAMENNWEWREDRSNGDLEYTRNRIRWELLPVLRGIFKQSFPDSLLRFAELCRLSREDLMARIPESVADAFKRVGNHLRIDVKKMEGVSKYIFVEILREHAGVFHSEGYVPSFERCSALYELCFRETGKKIEVWSGVWALKQRGFVLIGRKA